LVFLGINLADCELAHEKSPVLSKAEFEEQIKQFREETSASILVKVFMIIGFSISILELISSFMIRFHFFGFILAIVGQLIIDLNFYISFVQNKENELQRIKKDSLYRVKAVK
jgi:hypothetical protein